MVGELIELAVHPKNTVSLILAAQCTHRIGVDNRIRLPWAMRVLNQNVSANVKWLSVLAYHGLLILTSHLHDQT